MTISMSGILMEWWFHSKKLVEHLLPQVKVSLFFALKPSMQMLMRGYLFQQKFI